MDVPFSAQNDNGCNLGCERLESYFVSSGSENSIHYYFACNFRHPHLLVPASSYFFSEQNNVAKANVSSLKEAQ